MHAMLVILAILAASIPPAFAADVVIADGVLTRSGT